MFYKRALRIIKTFMDPNGVQKHHSNRWTVIATLWVISLAVCSCNHGPHHVPRRSPWSARPPPVRAYGPARSRRTCGCVPQISASLLPSQEPSHSTRASHLTGWFWALPAHTSSCTAPGGMSLWRDDQLYQHPSLYGCMAGQLLMLQWAKVMHSIFPHIQVHVQQLDSGPLAWSWCQLAHDVLFRSCSWKRSQGRCGPSLISLWHTAAGRDNRTVGQ